MQFFMPPPPSGATEVLCFLVMLPCVPVSVLARVPLAEYLTNQWMTFHQTWALKCRLVSHQYAVNHVYYEKFCIHFWDPEGRSQKATVVVLLFLVVISSLKIPKAFLIRSGMQQNFAYAFMLACDCLSAGVRSKHGSTHGEAFHLEAGRNRLDVALSSYWNQVTIPVPALTVTHSHLMSGHLQ